MECVRAAVANGADAVYLGLPRFNARMRADNFTEAELPGAVEFCHRHGVKVYVTFNTLVFTDELEAAAEELRLISRAGADAIIVQDIGLARLAREITPGLPIHASTQMTITSPEGVRFAKELGAELVVLARELSLREMAKFDVALPLEVFVHGALCVAYSGQCLTSESLGRRSANRGECAQACRMPYELVVDGALRDLGDKRYLLSPQDLAAVDEIPALIEQGIASFKIEGRLKSPEYVAAVCQVYRKAIDAALEQRAGGGHGGGPLQAGDDVFARALLRLDARGEPPGTRPRHAREKARAVSPGASSASAGILWRSNRSCRSNRATAWCSISAATQMPSKAGASGRSRERGCSSSMARSIFQKSRRATVCGRRTIPRLMASCEIVRGKNRAAASRASRSARVGEGGGVAGSRGREYRRAFGDRVAGGAHGPRSPRSDCASTWGGSARATMRWGI